MSTTRQLAPVVPGAAVPQSPRRETDPASSRVGSAPAPDPQVALLTGGGDKPYALGLATTLISLGIAFDFIGSDLVHPSELQHTATVRFFNLRGDQRTDVGRGKKAWRVLVYYVRLLRYAATARPRVFHILWNNKLEFIDRTLLLLYYRLCGKRLVFTAHNVNAARRDGHDSLFNRLTLKVQYRLVHHVFVHTKQMKQELQTDFGLSGDKISVIPFGINSTVPTTNLSSSEARQRLGLPSTSKVVLFFGHIAPYKGLEYLVAAISSLVRSDPTYRLLIGGRPKGCDAYWDKIRQLISQPELSPYVAPHIEFVPDEATEVFFKAADVIVLPYTHIFQSGVLFLAYNFGLPAIASDVGSLADDIVEGETGFIFKPRDPVDLVRALQTYFSNNLFLHLTSHRRRIREVAVEKYSWTKVGEITLPIYQRLLRSQPAGALEIRAPSEQ